MTRAAVLNSTSAAYLHTVSGKDLKSTYWRSKSDGTMQLGKRRLKLVRVQVPPISAEKLDEWMTYSLSEIVKNIGEAPLLVQIYSSKDKGGMSPVESPLATIPIPIIEKSKSGPESWVGVTRRWEEGSPVPDGIILVEQLYGRGADSSSCYILKICRVGSLFGFCTHFCLVKAKCFGEIADLQLKNSWLLSQLTN
ncbi:hypothetical protein MKX01_032687 [Papaver californicum]|nr:hypothetical protein MKX01_032687 [Papaver californicum]